MKKFNVKVNDKTYEVEVEEVKEAAPAPAPAAKPPPKPIATTQPEASKPKIAANSGGTRVNSPMPGTIAALEVKVGDTVKLGQVLLILEAMKMENEIPSPVDEEVASIEVKEGAAVKAGDLLLILK